jgi:hypothetical protein
VSNNEKGRKKMKDRQGTAAWLVGMVAASVLGVAGCESQGQFEEAGEEIDEAVDEIEDEVDDAT